MNRRRVLAAVAGVAGAAAPRVAVALEAVRVTSNPADAALEASYAVGLGFAAQAGLDCNVQLLANGAAAVSAILGGASDVGFSNLLSILVARQKGFPLVVVAAGAIYASTNPVSLLMVPNGSPIQTARDFAGRTIAVASLGDLAQFGPMAWLDANGGDSTAVHFVEMPFAVMPVALAEHRVDAAVVTEPFATRARESARVIAPAYDAIGARFLISVYFATPAWPAAHPEVARRFAALIYRTAAYANANHARTGELLMRLARLTPGQLAVTPRAIFAEGPDPALIAPLIDVAVKYRALANAVAPASLFAPEVLR